MIDLVTASRTGATAGGLRTVRVSNECTVPADPPLHLTGLSGRGQWRPEWYWGEEPTATAHLYPSISASQPASPPLNGRG
jgi:hypothetical protein